jgi:hypothetical protein
MNQQIQTTSAESPKKRKGGEKRKSARQSLLDERRELKARLHQIEKYLGLII